jgi:hypothetical protein
VTAASLVDGSGTFMEAQMCWMSTVLGGNSINVADGTRVGKPPDATQAGDGRLPLDFDYLLLAVRAGSHQRL